MPFGRRVGNWTWTLAGSSHSSFRNKRSMSNCSEIRFLATFVDIRNGLPGTCAQVLILLDDWLALPTGTVNRASAGCRLDQIMDGHMVGCSLSLPAVPPGCRGSRVSPYQGGRTILIYKYI